MVEITQVIVNIRFFENYKLLLCSERLHTFRIKNKLCQVKASKQLQY